VRRINSGNPWKQYVWGFPGTLSILFGMEFGLGNLAGRGQVVVEGRGVAGIGLGREMYIGAASAGFRLRGAGWTNSTPTGM